MDIGSFFEKMEAIVLSSTDAARDFRRLCRMGAETVPDPAWERLAAIDVAADVRAMGEWLERVLREEPPPARVEALWFGLLMLNPHDGMRAVMAISGSDAFDPEDADFLWAADPTYSPEIAFESQVIDELMKEAGSIGGPQWNEIQDLVQEMGDTWDPAKMAEIREQGGALFDWISGELSSAFLLGYLALAVSHVCRAADANLVLGGAKSRAVATGVMDINGIILGEMTLQGWIQSGIDRD